MAAIALIKKARTKGAYGQNFLSKEAQLKFNKRGGNAGGQKLHISIENYYLNIIFSIFLLFFSPNSFLFQPIQFSVFRPFLRHISSITQALPPDNIFEPLVNIFSKKLDAILQFFVLPGNEQTLFFVFVRIPQLADGTVFTCQVSLLFFFFFYVFLLCFHPDGWHRTVGQSEVTALITSLLCKMTSALSAQVSSLRIVFFFSEYFCSKIFLLFCFLQSNLTSNAVSHCFCVFLIKGN